VTPSPSGSAAAARAFGAGRIELVRGDITHQDTDAIVNAANSGLLGGGGVDGAIHRAGGPAILEECRRIRDARGPLPAGEAVVTGAGRLKCRHVVHAVGPIWQGGNAGEPALLASAYRNSINVAAGNGARTLALPSISTGAYGYPVAEAARIALATAREMLLAGSSPAAPDGGAAIDVLRWVLFSEEDLDTYRAALAALPD
jgi:O-acetyl-ADP-ribose deacetylase (regulator of RNase III)